MERPARGADGSAYRRGVPDWAWRPEFGPRWRASLLTRRFVGRRCRRGGFGSRLLLRLTTRPANRTTQELRLVGSETEALASAGGSLSTCRRCTVNDRDRSGRLDRGDGRRRCWWCRGRHVTGELWNVSWLAGLAGFPRFTILAVLLRLLRLWLTRLPEFAVLARLTWFAVLAWHAHLARFTRLIRVAELAFAMPVEPPLAAVPLRPVATLIAILAIMPLLAGVTVSEPVVLVLTILLLRPSLVERGLHVAFTGMAGEHRLIRASLVALAEIVAGAIVRAVMAAAAAVDHFTRLLNLLLAVSEDDPIVVLCVLQIILGEDVVAGGLGIAGELHVFLGDMGRCAAHLHIRAVRLEAAREGVLSLSVAGMVIVVVVVDVVAATATAMLLSLPHGLPISLLGVLRSFAQAQHLRRACVVRSFAWYPNAPLGLASADNPFSSFAPRSVAVLALENTARAAL